jgi:hypothetical protein
MKWISREWPKNDEKKEDGIDQRFVLLHNQIFRKNFDASGRLDILIRDAAQMSYIFSPGLVLSSDQRRSIT